MERTREAYELLEKGQPARAVEILLELDQVYPNRSEVIGGLVNAFYDLQDMLHYEHAVRRMSKMEPHNADAKYGLAGAHLVNSRPALALRTFKDALRRWPNHPKANDARRMLPDLEQSLREQAASLPVAEAQALDLVLQHDELRYYLDHAEFRLGRQAAEKLLQKFPWFIPALNNLSQIYAAEGDIHQAVQVSLRVLETEPENLHALSNLTRLHFLSGRPEEAAQWAQRLKNCREPATERWTKIAEALAFLEDDAGVLTLYNQARDAGELEPPATDEVFYHLLAAAAAFQGKEKQARQYWQKALQINPNFSWAAENLEDLERPEDERSGAWAFPFENWLLAALAGDLASQLGKVKRAANQSDVQQQLSRFLNQQHPRVVFLAPHLVKRGDARSRDFVMRTAAVTAHPTLVEVAKEFIFGKRGTFEERFKAAQILAEAQLLPPGPAKIWSGGQYSEIILMSIEISPEAEPSKLPPRAQLLGEKAFDALNARDGRRAQDLLEQALAIAPDDPSLMNNLAMAFELQDQDEKAHQMVRDIHARFPQYFFGVIGVAGLETRAGNTERAHELLDSLMSLKKMHPSEFTALCRAQINLSLAEDNPDAALSWLEMWEKVNPGHPELTRLRNQIGPTRSR